MKNGTKSVLAELPSCRRGIVHTFKNVGDEPSRMLIMTAPSGFEKFFARCAPEFVELDKSDMSRFAEIGAEHGIHFVQE